MAAGDSCAFLVLCYAALQVHRQRQQAADRCPLPAACPPLALSWPPMPSASFGPTVIGAQMSVAHACNAPSGRLCWRI